MFGKQKLQFNIAYQHTARTTLATLGLVVLVCAYVISFGLFAGPVQPVEAAIPKYINFQGKLTAVSNGNNVANGSYSFEFKLYDAPSGGSLLWTETWDGSPVQCPQLAVAQGVFNAKLGACEPLTSVDFTGGALYLTVNFNPGAGFDGEMTPRKQLVSSAYAFVANSVSGDGVVNNAIQSTTALSTGRTGANPALQVDTNTASSVTGLKVTSAAAAGGLALTTISSGTNENLTIDAKGSGSVSINGSATGDVLLGGGSASTGCTLTNSTGAFACTSYGYFGSGSAQEIRLGEIFGNAGLHAGGDSMQFNIASSSDDFLFTSAAGQLVTIKGTGNVGIGTTAPTNLSGSYFGATQINPLWVSANDAAKVTALVVQGNLGEAIQFVNESGVAEADFGVYTTDIYFVNRQASGNIRFDTNGSTSMFVGSNNNVGIGTGISTPAAKLEIKGATGQLSTLIGDAGFGTSYAGLSMHGALTTGNYSLLGDATNLYINRPSSGDIFFRENNITQMTIKTSTGNVGIGDTSPASLFTVGSGDLFQVNSSGAIAASVGITTAGGAVSLNNNSNFATSISTGTNNTLTTIGGGSGTFSLQTTNIDISSAGAITDATGFNGLVVTANTGVITTGTWNGTAVGSQYGGTGQNFSASSGVPSINSGTWQANAITQNGVMYGGASNALSFTAVGTTGQCLVGNTAAAPSWSSCAGLVTLQAAYGAGNTIETASNNPVIITETTTGAVTGDLLQLTVNQATGGTFAGDAIQITMDGVDANAYTGNGLNIIVDQSQNTGSPILVQDDAATTLFQLSENGAITLGAATAETTAITITDTDFTNALSIADNNIVGTTSAIDFTNFDVSSVGAVVAVGVNSGSGLLQGTGGLTLTGTTNINTSGSSAVNIGTGGATSLVTIGGGSGTFSLQTTNIDISSAGAISGVTGYIQGSGTMRVTSANTNQSASSSALALVAGSVNSGTGFYVGTLGITTGNGMQIQGSGATMQTGGELIDLPLGANTVGAGITITSTGVYTGTGAADALGFNVVGNSLTTGHGSKMSFTGMTSGTGLLITGGGANLATNAELVDLQMGAATAGNGLAVTTSGVYTGTGLITLTANSATTGTIQGTSATGLTTGIAQSTTLGSALTTGGAYRVSSASYNHGSATETGSLVSLAFTDATNGTATSTTNGILISPTVNVTTGASGTKTINGVSVAPTFTACTGGSTCNPNGVNIGNVTDGTGITSAAIRLGTGWDTLISGTTAGGNLIDFTNFKITSAGVASALTGLSSSGTIQFSSLTTNGALYTSGGNGTLTTTAPTSGTIGYWSRTGTTLQPATANDVISVSGNSGDIVTIASSATGSANKALNVSQTGATSGTDYAGYFSNTGAATTNVGLYSTATGATNNYAAIFDAGNVGIGNSSPTYKLDVTAGNVDGIRIVSSNSTSLRFDPSTGTGINWAIATNYTTTDRLEILQSPSNGTAPSTSVLNINGATGFMGIGISTAAANRLDVYGSVSIGTSYYATAAPSNGLIVQGTTGIGTSGPDRKLDVLDASSPQVRLTTTDGSVYSELQNTATANLTVTGSSLVSTSGMDYGMRINPTVNQASGSAGYTGLFMNTTETALGSGTYSLMDLQRASTSYFRVAKRGGIISELYNLSWGGEIPSGQDGNGSNSVVLGEKTGGGLGLYGAGVGINSKTGYVAVHNTAADNNIILGRTAGLVEAGYKGIHDRQLYLQGNSTDGASAEGVRIQWDANVATPNAGAKIATFGYIDNSDVYQEKLTVMANGNVGIGTTSPGALLDVDGAIHSRSGGVYTNQINTYTATSLILNGSTGAVINANGSPALTVISSGNVGIGDTSPASLFTVGSGDLFQVNSSGAIAAATGIISSGTIRFSALTTNGALYTSGGNGTLTTTAPTSGALGYWTRTGTVLSQTTANDTISIANTTTTGADLALTNTGVYTGTGIFNLTANSATTGTLAALSGSGLTSGSLISATLGSSLTTGSLLSTSGASYNPGSGNTGNLINLSFTNNSTSTSGVSVVSGINIAPTITASGTSGTHDTYSIRIQNAAGSPVNGTQNIYGMRIGNQGASGGETSYGLYVDSQTGAINSYAAVFAGGNVGVGVVPNSANGILQVAGSIGMTGNTEIRQSTNSDGNTLRVLATQLVAANSNSNSYNYSGGGLIAGVSPSGSALLLDVGANDAGTGHRLKVTNDGSGVTGTLFYGTPSLTTLHANSSNGRVGIGTSSPSEQLQITGNFRIPTTTSTTGIIYQGSSLLMHTYGDNFFAGPGAGNLTLTNVYNTGVGKNSLDSLTSGYYNTALGQNSLTSNTTGPLNVAVGYDSLVTNTNGGYNVALGGGALGTANGANNNVAVGYNAGAAVTNGYYNTLLGDVAGDNITSGYHNIVIGAGIDAQSATGANQLTIGNIIFGTGIDGTGTSLSSGNIGIGIVAPSEKLEIGSGGNISLVSGYLLQKANGRTRYYNSANSNYSDIYNPSTGGGAELAIIDGSGTGIRLNGSGNVGINATTFGTSNKLLVNAYSTVDNNATAQINSANASHKGLVVQGFASQSADLFQAQQSNGTVAFGVGGNSNATVYGLNFAFDQGNSKYVFGTATLPGDAAFAVQNSWSTSAITMKVKAIASQTADLLQLQNSSGAALLATSNYGSITSGFTQLDGSTTAVGTGSNSTSLTVASDNNFDIGNYVKVDPVSGNCSGSTAVCYAKIIDNPSANLFIISPALTWDNGATVVEMHVPEVGGNNTTDTLANRYGRGYFIDGIVAGNGSTYYSDGGISQSLASSTFNFLNNGNTTTLNLGTSATNVNVAGRLTVASGDLTVGAQSNATDAVYSANTTGQGVVGPDSDIDAISSFAIFNGKLYAASEASDESSVYRYDGGTAWTRVTDATRGKVVSADTDAIDSMVLTVFNGKLYAGTRTGSSQGTAAVYAYDGSTWTMLNDVLGDFDPDTDVDDVSDLVVYNGTLFMATSDDGGASNVYSTRGFNNALTIRNTYGNATCYDEGGGITSGKLVVYNGMLIWGASGLGGDSARLCAYTSFDQGYTWQRLNTLGTFNSSTGIDSINALAVHNGKLYFSISDGSDTAEIYSATFNSTDVYAMRNGQILEPGAFKVESKNPGVIDSTESAVSDRVPALRTHNGRLYAASDTGSGGNSGRVYEYDDTNSKFNYITTTAGAFAVNSSIDGAESLISFNGTLYVGTKDPTRGTVYSWNKTTANSYALKFDSGSGNYGSISFSGNSTGQNNTSNMGSFLFSHSLVSTTGAYDIAEDYPTREQGLVAGDVLSLNPNETGLVVRSSVGYDRTVVGIYSTNPGLRLSQEEAAINGLPTVPVALAGRVPVNIAPDSAPIAAGDAIVSSGTYPGKAMKALVNGPTIGKALESWTPGTGQTQVLVLVNLSWNGSSTGASSDIVLQAASDTAVNISDNTGSTLFNVNTNTRKLTIGTAADSAELELFGNIIVRGDAQIEGSIMVESVIAESIVAEEVTAETITSETVTAENVVADSVKVSGNSISENYESSDDSIEAGEVVAIDNSENGLIGRPDTSGSKSILGVVVEESGLELGSELEEGSGNTKYSVALIGRAQVKVSNENGEIMPGDFLANSATIPGAAMKATKTGSVIGQALETFTGGIGKIDAFIKPSNYNGLAIEDQLAGLTFDYTGTEQGLLNSAQNSSQILEYLISQLPSLDSENLSEVVTDVVVANGEIITPTVTTQTLRADFLSSATSDGGLSVASTTMFNGGLTVDTISAIGDLLSFSSDVEFFGTPYFTSDTAGFAVVKAGVQSVDVVFTREYLAQPIVNASISFEQDVDQELLDEEAREVLKNDSIAAAQTFLAEGITYVVTNKSKFGFTIVLSKPAPSDVKMSWTALAVRNATTFMSIDTPSGFVAGADDASGSENTPENNPDGSPDTGTPPSGNEDQPPSDSPSDSPLSDQPPGDGSDS